MKKILVSMFGLVWLLFSIFLWTSSPQESSLEERRKLAQFPTLSSESFLNGDFSNKFEGYIQDQFPNRFRIRQLKASFRYHGLRIFENNSYFIDEQKIMKTEYPLKESEIKKAGQTFASIRDNYLSHNDIYISIIPEKSYYSTQSHVRKLDYEKMEELLLQEMGEVSYIDIKDTLDKYDYYNTDIHWKQDHLEQTSQRLLSAMGKEMGAFNVNETHSEFKGVYHGHSALKTPFDTINYISNDAINTASVTLLDQEGMSVYNQGALTTRDPYDFFLYGAQAIVEIENESATREDELIVFRDSFGSSLAPYFIDSYKKITLIDIRYVTSKSLNEFVEFKDQDVLFIYSGTVLNSSSSFK